MLQGYQIRMLEEYKQLNDRVEKLGKFINESPVFSKMENDGMKRKAKKEQI